MSCEYKEKCYRLNMKHINTYHKGFNERNLYCKRCKKRTSHKFLIGGDWYSSRIWSCKPCGYYSYVSSIKK